MTEATATLTASETAIEAEVQENQLMLAARDTRPTVKITVNQFRDMVHANVNGCSIVSVHAVTEPKCNKKHRASKAPVADVVALPIRKSYSVNFGLGADYEKCVRNQIERDGGDPESFTAGEHKWMDTLEKADGSYDQFFGVHSRTGEIYLKVARPIRCGSPVFVDGNGERIEGEALADIKENLFRKPSGSAYINVAMRNARYVAMRGILYEILR